MADPRFFENNGPFALADIAEAAGAILADEGQGEILINDVAPLSSAGEGHISFLDNVKYKEEFKNTKAVACIIAPELQALAPAGCALLLSKTPYKSYALIAQKFYPQTVKEGHVASSARIHESAEIGSDVVIEEGAVIGAGVKIGNKTRIGANAVISHAIIGDYVHIYPGVCIGQDGFGFAIDPQGHVKVPQLGRVIIEDHVEIGANTTIDRGAGPDTIIGQGTWIDNLVQIGHNVKIGRGCVIVAQAGVSGSTEIGDFVALGGQVGIAGHLKIGMGAQIAAQSGIMRDVPAGTKYMGYPAVPMKEFLKQVATLSRLIKKGKSA